MGLPAGDRQLASRRRGRPGRRRRICTADNSHFEIAMAAIAAGKHVYCEKPLATRADRARQMADAARKKGLIPLMSFNYIQNPVHALAISSFRNGDISEVRHRAYCSNPTIWPIPTCPLVAQQRTEPERRHRRRWLSLPQLLLSFGRREGRRGLLQPRDCCP